MANHPAPKGPRGAKHPHDAKRPESQGVLKALDIYAQTQDIEPLRQALTPRQRLFCEEYVVDYDGAKAVIRAGYSKNYADRQAFVLRKNRGVQTYIDHLGRSKEAAIISVDPEYIIARLVAIIGKEGARDGDKIRALEILARHKGMFVDRTEITGKDGDAIRIEQQRIEAESRDFANMIRLMGKKKEVTID